MAAYDALCWIERRHHSGTRTTGATLDLVKCFNLIRRSFVLRAMTQLGCPATIVSKWATTIQPMTRFWEVDGSISEEVEVSAGCAEGDPVSVYAMISLAVVWVYTCPQSPHLRLNAYADNWSWAVSQLDLHEPIIAATHQVCKAAGLQVDPAKTWTWASHAADRQQLRDATCSLCPQSPHLQCLEGASDLGVHTQYSGPSRLGTLQDRLQEGLTRLERIRHTNWDLPVTQHVIKSSVYPAAFHGAEHLIIGEHHLRKFRRKVAETLADSSAKTMSPTILLLLVQPELPDPSLFLFLQALKQARRWLLQAPAEQRRAFLSIASQPPKPSGQTHGPAEALSGRLDLLGWSIVHR